MKGISRKAGLENDKFRNHSARKTMIQTLSENDVPPTQIEQFSGHHDKPEKHRKLHPRAEPGLSLFPFLLHRGKRSRYKAYEP